jgi:hypothetical protein
MTDPVRAFRATAEAAQLAAGVISARHRGDLDGASTLLGTLDDRSRAAGCLLLADLAVALLAQAEGRDIGDVAADLSLELARLAPEVGE